MHTDVMNDTNLISLKELENFVREETGYDIRSWKVKDSNDEEVGIITDVVVDPSQKTVRYIDMAMHTSEGDNKNLIIPIGHVSLEMDNRAVKLPDLSKEELRKLPVYDDTPVSRAYEVAVRKRLQPDFNEEDPGLDFYDHALYKRGVFMDQREKGLKGNFGRGFQG